MVHVTIVGMTDRTLTDLEKDIIDYAYELGRRKVTDIGMYADFTARFGWRPITFSQRLNALLKDPAAERERPVEVRALRRLVEVRRAARDRPFTLAS